MPSPVWSSGPNSKHHRGSALEQYFRFLQTKQTNTFEDVLMNPVLSESITLEWRYQQPTKGSTVESSGWSKSERRESGVLLLCFVQSQRLMSFSLYYYRRGKWKCYFLRRLTCVLVLKPYCWGFGFCNSLCPQIGLTFCVFASVYVWP